MGGWLIFKNHVGKNCPSYDFRKTVIYGHRSTQASNIMIIRLNPMANVVIPCLISTISTTNRKDTNKLVVHFQLRPPRNIDLHAGHTKVAL